MALLNHFFQWAEVYAAILTLLSLPLATYTSYALLRDRLKERAASDLSEVAEVPNEASPSETASEEKAS